MASKFYKRGLNFIQQRANICKNYKTLKDIAYDNHLDVELIVKPTDNSKEYTVQIIYSKKLGGKYLRPQVILRNQNIVRSEEETLIIPHKYEAKYNNGKDFVRLCLYLPKNNEWNENMYISETIIPWTIEWLRFYEFWRITGEWLGGGVHSDKYE